jgi:ankyrin repeat protein
MLKAPDLIAAIRAQDVKAVRRLLDEEPALVDARAATGESAVRAAVYVGAEEIAKLLVARGAKLDAFDAAAAGETAALERAITADRAAANGWSEDGWTPLHLGAFFGRLAAVRMLLEHGADPHAVSRNPTANTPLHAAAVRGHLEVVALLLDRGADHARAAGGGYTALHIAAGAGHEQVVALLLARGANREALDREGRNALAVAEATHHAKVAALLRRGVPG